MSLENPQVNLESLTQNPVNKIFQTKRSIEDSIKAVTRGKFADHHLRVDEQRITIQALYGNEFRLYLADSQEVILFEPTPYNDRVLEVTSTPYPTDLEIHPKTLAYVFSKDCESRAIISNGDSTHKEKPMGEVEFNNANRLLGKIQTVLNTAINDRIT